MRHSAGVDSTKVRRDEGSNGMCGSVAPGPADPLVYIEQIRLLCCEYEIRTNSRDLITRLSGFTPHAEQDMPVVQRRTVIITWTGDEFQISSDGIDDFELSQTGALETLFQHLHRSAIAAMPDYIRLQAVTGNRAERSFLIAGPQRAGKSTLALRLMLGGLDVTGDELVLLRNGMAIAFPRKFRVREDCLGLMPRSGPIDRIAASVGNPQEDRFVALDPQTFGKPWRIEPAAVSTIFYIEPNHGARSALRRSGKVEMARRLLPYCAPPKSGRRDWLGDLCATIDRAETLVIELGDLDSAVELSIDALR